MSAPTKAKGWGMIVKGPRPYIAGVFEWSKEALVTNHVTEKYHKPVRVVISLEPKKRKAP